MKTVGADLRKAVEVERVGRPASMKSAINSSAHVVRRVPGTRSHRMTAA